MQSSRGEEDGGTIEEGLTSVLSTNKNPGPLSYFEWGSSLEIVI